MIQSMARIPLHLTLPDSHYAAIGKVAANWAAFERLMESALWVLAGVGDYPGACLTSQIPNMARRFDALLALARLKNVDEKIIKKLQQFSHESQTLNLQRNRIIHDAWHWNFATQRALRLELSAAKRLTLGLVETPEAAVMGIAEEIANHIDRFDKIIDEVFSAASPPLRKRR
jgi:hypothetical protein